MTQRTLPLAASSIVWWCSLWGAGMTAPWTVPSLALGGPQALDTPAVVVVPVPLPLRDDIDMRIIASVDKRLDDLPASEQRPIVVFEFQPQDTRAPEPSSFERSLALARYIAGDRFSRVRTVAFLPGLVDGHAVLPVLACEEIISHPDAQLGAAGRGETSIGPTLVAAYREIAERRRTIPFPWCWACSTRRSR
jgi:membrane-bound serine protease (ClpP class)